VCEATTTSPVIDCYTTAVGPAADNTHLLLADLLLFDEVPLKQEEKSDKKPQKQVSEIV